MAIEVEHKFLVAAHTRDTLTTIGATRQGCCSFTDIYYDTADHSLTFQDHWLRKRDGSWQLKSPLQSHSSKPLTDQYRETEIEGDILKLLWVSEILSQGEHGLEQLVTDGQLLPISEFTTTREMWQLRTSGVDDLSVASIVLDSTDSGYEVGEVEVNVETPSLVSIAEKLVRDLANQIGESPQATPGGKLSSHLFKTNHSLWQQLVDKGVMRKP